jgi:HipA-like protein
MASELIKRLAREGGRKVARLLNMRASTPPDVHADFRLRLGELPVGTLSVKNGKWTFRYADEFRSRPNVRPLPVFPDLQKIYESDELFPFFRTRVPSLKRKAIRAIMAEDGLDETDQIELLRRFGRKTISNPFELIEDQSVPARPVIVARPRTPKSPAQPIVLQTRPAAVPLVASTYEITTKAGRPVTAGLFKSADEIFSHVGALPPGAYHVYQVLPSETQGTRESRFWGEVTSHANGQVSYAPVSSSESSAR